MKKLKLPAFGERKFFDDRMTKNCRVVLLEEQQPDSFRAYCDLAARSGYACKEQFSAAHRSFAAYEKDGAGLFINYFENTAQLQLVTEDNCAYFTYVDKAGEYRFRLKATNGQIIAVSEGYKAMASCLNGIESVKKNAPEAEIAE